MNVLQHKLWLHLLHSTQVLLAEYLMLVVLQTTNSCFRNSSLPECALYLSVIGAFLNETNPEDFMNELLPKLPLGQETFLCGVLNNWVFGSYPVAFTLL